ncbi:MAG: hypothetical protein ACKO7W_11200 [Elainella sp.]
MKIQKLFISGFVAVTAVLGSGLGAFEYWINLQANQLSKSITEGKLTQVSDRDIHQLDQITHLLSQSPLPWHRQEAQRFTDLTEVATAAQHSFSDGKVSRLQIGRLLTLQQEMENYIQRYPSQPYADALKQELPAVRALTTFFPVIKASAGERSVDSALRSSRRGATLAALVIRKAPELPDVAVAVVPTLSWSKAENDVLYDYSEALQAAERQRINDSARLEIGRQVCSWLNAGQSYWGVRSMFDSQYKGTLAGDYSHNRDVYIRFSTERLCPNQVASLTPPPEAPVLAKAPAAAKLANTAAKARTVADPAPQYAPQYDQPSYGQLYGQGYAPYPVPVVPGPRFPGNIR